MCQFIDVKDNLFMRINPNICYDDFAGIWLALWLREAELVCGHRDGFGCLIAVPLTSPESASIPDGTSIAIMLAGAVFI